MKLIHLFMQNVGAFNKPTEIDFSKLNEIFLICGNTGSGKTTIFDAVTFALYGKLPGSRSSLEIRRFRSDFAHDDEESFVTLQFSIHRDVYKIYRSLPQPYKKRDGTRGFKNSNATLHIRQSGALNGELNFSQEEQWDIISDSIEDIKNKIEQLLGLNCDEFTRIVLLPQGEFADFLKLNSNDRKEALSKLFPIELYSSIMEIAKEKSSQYKVKIESLETRIKDLRSMYDEEQSAVKEKSLNQKITQAKKKKQTLNEHLQETLKHKQKNDIILKEIENRIIYEHTLSSLLEQEKEIKQGVLTLHKAKQALSLQAEIKNVKQSSRLLKDTEQRTLEITEQCNNAQTTYTALQKEKKDITKLEDEIKNLDFALKDITEAEEAEREYSKLIIQRDEKKELVKNNTKKLSELNKELQALGQNKTLYSDLSQKYKDAVNRQIELEKTLHNAKEIYDKCILKNNLLREKEQYETLISTLQIETQTLEKNLDTAKKSLLDFEQEKEKNLLLHEAHILAQKLEEGKPCPVCGSVEHPHKAAKIEHTAPLEDKITSQKMIIETAEKELYKKRSELFHKQGQHKTLEDTVILTKTDISIEEAEEQKNIAQAKVNTSIKHTDELLQEMKQQEEYTKQMEELEKNIKPLEDAIHQHENSLILFEQDIERNSELFEKKTKPHYSILLALSIQEKDLCILSFSKSIVPKLRETLQKYEQKTSLFRESFQKAEQLLTSLNAQKNELENTLLLRRSEAEEDLALLQKALNKTEFKNVDEAQSAYLEESSVIVLEEKVNNWHKEKDTLVSLITSSKEKYPQSLESVKSTIMDSETTLEHITASLQDIERELENLHTTLTTLEHTKEQLQSYDKELFQLQNEGEKHIKLHMLLSNQNPKKIPFDAWVLGLYLEEITLHASSRLHRISDGRYTLLLKTEEGGGKDKIKGLDLEIFDAFTGKKRPCATLSGGETFMTSISLALALTDVVQSKAGGISLDSLFIDEGFGSLDDASLERALSILDEIREKRTVGIISHVGDLKSRISSHILVTKGQNGSSVSIYN